MYQNFQQPLISQSQTSGRSIIKSILPKQLEEINQRSSFKPQDCSKDQLNLGIVQGASKHYKTESHRNNQTKRILRSSRQEIGGDHQILALKDSSQKFSLIQDHQDDQDNIKGYIQTQRLLSDERVIDDQNERLKNTAREFLPKEIRISKELLNKVMNRQLSTKSISNAQIKCLTSNLMNDSEKIIQIPLTTRAQNQKKIIQNQVLNIQQQDQSMLRQLKQENLQNQSSASQEMNLHSSNFFAHIPSISNAATRNLDASKNIFKIDLSNQGQIEKETPSNEVRDQIKVIKMAKIPAQGRVLISRNHIKSGSASHSFTNSSEKKVNQSLFEKSDTNQKSSDQIHIHVLGEEILGKNQKGTIKTKDADIKKKILPHNKAKYNHFIKQSERTEGSCKGRVEGQQKESLPKQGSRLKQRKQFKETEHNLRTKKSEASLAQLFKNNQVSKQKTGSFENNREKIIKQAQQNDSKISGVQEKGNYKASLTQRNAIQNHQPRQSSKSRIDASKNSFKNEYNQNLKIQRPNTVVDKIQQKSGQRQHEVDQGSKDKMEKNEKSKLQRGNKLVEYKQLQQNHSLASIPISKNFSQLKLAADLSSEENQTISIIENMRNQTFKVNDDSEVQQTDRSNSQINTKTLIKQFIKNNSLKQLIKNTQAALEIQRINDNSKNNFQNGMKGCKQSIQSKEVSNSLEVQKFQDSNPQINIVISTKDTQDFNPLSPSYNNWLQSSNNFDMSETQNSKLVTSNQILRQQKPLSTYYQENEQQAQRAPEQTTVHYYTDINILQTSNMPQGADTNSVLSIRSPEHIPTIETQQMTYSESDDRKSLGVELITASLDEPSLQYSPSQYDASGGTMNFYKDLYKGQIGKFTNHADHASLDENLLMENTRNTNPAMNIQLDYVDSTEDDNFFNSISLLGQTQQVQRNPQFLTLDSRDKTSLVSKNLQNSNFNNSSLYHLSSNQLSSARILNQKDQFQVSQRFQFTNASNGELLNSFITQNSLSAQRKQIQSQNYQQNTTSSQRNDNLTYTYSRTEESEERKLFSESPKFKIISKKPNIPQPSFQEHSVLAQTLAHSQVHQQQIKKKNLNSQSSGIATLTESQISSQQIHHMLTPITMIENKQDENAHQQVASDQQREYDLLSSGAAGVQSYLWLQNCQVQSHKSGNHSAGSSSFLLRKKKLLDDQLNLGCSNVSEQIQKVEDDKSPDDEAYNFLGSSSQQNTFICKGEQQITNFNQQQQQASFAHIQKFQNPSQVTAITSQAQSESQVDNFQVSHLQNYSGCTLSSNKSGEKNFKAYHNVMGSSSQDSFAGFHLKSVNQIPYFDQQSFSESIQHPQYYITQADNQFNRQQPSLKDTHSQKKDFFSCNNQYVKEYNQSQQQVISSYLKRFQDQQEQLYRQQQKQTDLVPFPQSFAQQENSHVSPISFHLRNSEFEEEEDFYLDQKSYNDYQALLLYQEEERRRILELKDVAQHTLYQAEQRFQKNLDQQQKFNQQQMNHYIHQDWMQKKINIPKSVIAEDLEEQENEEY